MTRQDDLEDLEFKYAPTLHRASNERIELAASKGGDDRDRTSIPGVLLENPSWPAESSSRLSGRAGDS
jgi:hypothetical protein